MTVGAAILAVIAVAGITYAKWWPYGHKVVKVLSAHAYPGTSIFASAGSPGAAPTWHATWSFVASYGNDVWVALIVAILVGAGVETLLPETTIGLLRRPGRARSSLFGGLLSLPCLMCTCCTAPVTRSMRRAGVPVSAALSYWLGNPLLNPVVLLFLALVLPWQYAAARLVLGAVLVFAVAPVVARLAPHGAGLEPPPAEAPVPLSIRTTPVRYLRAVGRLVLLLVPEYFVVVVAVGAFRGWLFPLGHGAESWGVLAGLVAATAGTLLVIPTAAEIPIIVGLIAIGFSPLVTGALLISLPALSLPSMVMVGRALSARVTAATCLAVMACSLAAGGLLVSLGA
ncbi:MAG: permease [Acidimicrobiales bacterium]